MSSASTTSTRPTSPALTETTNASQMNFGFEGPERIVTRADLKNSAQAYENVRNPPMCWDTPVLIAKLSLPVNCRLRWLS